MGRQVDISQGPATLGGLQLTAGLLKLLDTQRDILDIAMQSHNVRVCDAVLTQIHSTCSLIDQLHNLITPSYTPRRAAPRRTKAEKNIENQACVRGWVIRKYLAAGISSS